MKSLIILAATIACAYSYALVSLPPNYKEKYPDLFKNGRQPRDLTSALKQIKDPIDYAVEKDDDIDEDKDTKTTADVPRHPIELTPKQVELEVSSPNASTDRPKLVTEATTESTDTTKSSMKTVEITPTMDPEVKLDTDSDDIELDDDVMISEEETEDN